MPLLPLVGHRTLRAKLASAINRGTLPQLLLITGPAGIGKQRLGLWLAQRLFCEQAAEEPCGNCRSCKLVLGLNHSDLHWIIPVPRPKASEADKQVEELQEQLAEVLEERRQHPLYGPPEGMATHFVATARLLIRRASLRPVEGRMRVFLLGHAERLVPQESSPEAANALLKLLEEPGPDTYFVLTAEDPESVLPTIRSRAVQIRAGTLRDDEVRQFLAGHAGLAGAELESAVSQGQGSIGKAISDPAGAAKGAAFAAILLQGALEREPMVWEQALKQTPFSARGEFTATLDAMAELLTDALRPGRPRSPLAAVAPRRLLAALERVEDARELAHGNVNPQLLLAVLGQDLVETL